METVRTETRGGVFVVTIDRVEVRNAVDAETAEGLAEAFYARKIVFERTSRSHAASGRNRRSLLLGINTTGTAKPS